MPKSINKRQPASNNNIILVYGVLCHGWYTPSTPIFGVIHPLAMPFLCYRVHLVPDFIKIKQYFSHKYSFRIKQLPPDEDNTVENCNGL